MDRIQKQSLVILIQGIKQQLSALEGLLTLTTPAEKAVDEQVVAQKSRSLLQRYTNAEDDRLIAEALAIPKDFEMNMVQDIFNEAAQGMSGDGDSERHK